MKIKETDPMPLTRIDEKGRMVLPNEIRRNMGINPGDEFVVDKLGPDTIIFKKVNVKAMIQDAIEQAKDVDLAKLEKEMEEEGNKAARGIYETLD